MGAWIRDIVWILVIVFTIRSFAVEPFHIPSESMKETLLVGDYIFVSKYAYGYSRYSFPFGLPLFKGRMLEETPERGDIVVFRSPADPRVDFIKRMIGLPGDRVQMRGGVLHINGERVPKRRDGRYAETLHDGTAINAARFLETLPSGRNYHVLDAQKNGVMDDTPVHTVPEGYYFVMGDNRDHSYDSRAVEIGLIPAENLIGRAEIILFSIDESTRFWEFWKWFDGGIRPDRFIRLLNRDVGEG